MTFGMRILVLAGFFFAGFFVKRSVKTNNKPLILVSSLFGIGAALAAVILNGLAGYVLHLKDGLDARAHPATHEIIISTLVFVVIEETVKFVPLALFLLRRKYFTMLSDGILYFGLAGLTFGSVEHILYEFNYGDFTLLIRVFLVLFLHAGLTGLVGYFYAKDKVLGNRYRTILAFMAAIGLHYLYNLSLFMTSKSTSTLVQATLAVLAWTIATGLNCLLLWLFYVSSQRDWHRISSLEVRPAHEVARVQ